MSVNFPPSGYLVVTATDLFDLEADVKARIEEGWQLQGGVSISFRPTENDSDSFIIFAQAMIRNEKQKGGVYSAEKDATVALGEAVERFNEKIHSVRPGEVTIVIRDKDAFADMFAFEIGGKGSI